MKLRSIQVLRAVAAIAVVVHHATDAVTLTGPGRYGAFGVDLFFVISGFIMATIGRDQSPARFLAARAERILPMWWLALIPWLVLVWPGAAGAVASAALWPIYGGAFHLPALSVGWTLGFELLFYLAFSLALAARAWVPIALFASAAVASLAAPGNALFDYLGSGLVAEFLLGTLVALAPKRERLALPALALAIALACLASPHYSAAIRGADAWRRAITWGIPAALTVYAAVSAERWFSLRIFAAAVFLGDASFSIYLFHPLVARHGPWVVGSLASVALGAAAYLMLERPLLRLRSHQRHAATVARRDSHTRIEPCDRLNQRCIGASWRV